MRFYLTTRPLLICHPTMQLISNVSNLKIWVSHQDDLESLDVYMDPLVEHSWVTSKAGLQNQVPSIPDTLEPVYHTLEYPKYRGYTVTIVCMSLEHAEQLKILNHTCDRRYVIEDKILIVGCRESQRPTLIFDFQEVPDGILPEFVATLLHHACSSNPYTTPEDTYKQTVQTFDNPILTALIESWLASGELVLSE